MMNYDWGGYYYPGPMMQGDWGNAILPMWIAILAPWILLLIIWSVFWKGLALWHSARRGQYWWFLFMLVLNTAGILEIIYLFGIAKITWGHLFKVTHNPESHR